MEEGFVTVKLDQEVCNKDMSENLKGEDLLMNEKEEEKWVTMVVKVGKVDLF